MSFFTGTPASANVMAIDRVVCWAIPHESLRQFVESHSGGAHLALNIAVLLARRVQDGNTRLMGMRESEPLTNRERSIVRSKIESNEVDIVPWLEQGQQGRQLKGRPEWLRWERVCRELG